MKETLIQVFVDILVKYLAHFNEVDAEVGIPYLGESAQQLCYDVTGVIGVTGSYTGMVSFSAPKGFLVQLILMQGEQNVSDDNIADMAGEIANTISGNARSEFGDQFTISVPDVVVGDIDTSSSDNRPCVIPVSWKHFESVLTVSLKPS